MNFQDNRSSIIVIASLVLIGILAAFIRFGWQSPVPIAVSNYRGNAGDIVTIDKRIEFAAEASEEKLIQLLSEDAMYMYGMECAMYQPEYSSSFAITLSSRGLRKLISDYRTSDAKRVQDSINHIWVEKKSGILGFSPNFKGEVITLRPNSNGIYKLPKRMSVDANTSASAQFGTTSSKYYGLNASLILSAEFGGAKTTAQRLGEVREKAQFAYDTIAKTQDESVAQQMKDCSQPDQKSAVSILALAVQRDEQLSRGTKSAFRRAINSELDSGKLISTYLTIGAWDSRMTVFDRPHRTYGAPLESDGATEYELFWWDPIDIGPQDTMIDSLIAILCDE